MEVEEKIYLSGFNAGYYVRKFIPKLFNRLSTTFQGKSDFADAFIEGGKECKREIRLAEISNSKSNNIDREPEQ